MIQFCQICISCPFSIFDIFYIRYFDIFTLISLLVSSSDFYLDLIFNHCLPNSTKISTTSEMICWGQLSSKVTDINFMQFTKTASAAVLKTTQLLGNCNCRMQLNLPNVMPRKLRFPTDFNIHSFKIHFNAGGEVLQFVDLKTYQSKITLQKFCPLCPLKRLSYISYCSHNPNHASTTI